MPVGKTTDRTPRSGSSASANASAKGEKSNSSSASSPMPATGHRNISNSNMTASNSRGGGNSGNGHSVAESGQSGTNNRGDGPRSPPNTSHVPCKFFRQGACQAGNACPFSHDIGAAAENVCKYFAKGNCKFGPKCANIHVLPDGRRVNYGKHGLTLGNPALAIGRQHHNPTAYNQTSTVSALTFSLNGEFNNPDFSYEDSSSNQQGGAGTPVQQTPNVNTDIPAIDVPYPTDAFSSPREEPGSARFGLGLSPIGTGFNVLDAPLPASFDSTGVSNAALFPSGPWPASVPSKFGMESPLPSYASPDPRGSEALKMLHTSAFGGEKYLSTSNVMVGGSPSANLLAVGEEQFGRRTMHMHSSRFTKPKALSSSVPKGPVTVDRDWDPEFAFLEEDYVPQNLQDLLTPAEKARRGSLRATDAEEPIGLSGSYKYGSPILSASPSRWGLPFQRQKEEEEAAAAAAAARASRVSAFGVVGSPLRNSSLASDMRTSALSAGLASSMGGKPLSGSFTNSFSGGGDGFSMLSHQLRQTRLNDDTSRLSGSPLGSSSFSGLPSLSVPSAPSGISGLIGLTGSPGPSGLKERHINIPTATTPTTRLTTTIDEEDPSMLFDMEEHEHDHQNPAAHKNEGNNGINNEHAAALDGKNEEKNIAGAGVPKPATTTAGFSYSAALKSKAAPAVPVVVKKSAAPSS
ncbi:Protein cps3 [Ceratocystis fimbriata CBS 114723]|uniref:Protein cps3 n=1 Tax=Ceratocystis fimbriata CBS 114723 TaxID=1035309 RepID=A0A2C5X0Q1_9PEZI|nr:Protein cps3 [Ceratocystis fimbriata CBS 114723]